MLRRKTKWTVGIHILDNHAKLVEVENMARGIRVKRQELIQLEAGSVRNGKVEDEESVIARIKTAVEDLRLERLGASLAVPTSTAVLRRAVFPALKDRELRNRIEVDLLARDQLPFKDPVFDFIRLGEPQNDAAASSETLQKSNNKLGDEEVLIFATPADVVESYTAIIEESGLIPMAVELAPLSLHRLLIDTLLPVGRETADRFMLIHAESEYADICIFENGIPVFMRQQMLPVNYMLDSESDRVSTYGRNLTMEVSRILNYYKYSISSNQQEVQQVFLSGDHDWLLPLTEQLSGSFSGPIYSLAVDAAVLNYQALHHSFTVPIGLAIKGA